MVARDIVTTTPATGRVRMRPAAVVVHRPTQPTSERFKVCNRQNHTPINRCHTRHFSDSLFRPVKMIYRTLTNRSVEAPGRKRQIICPTTNPGRHRPFALRGKQARHSGHPLGGLRPHDLGPKARHGNRILPYTARDIENLPARSRTGKAQCHLGHFPEQKLTVRGRTRRDDITHITIKINDSHGGPR